MRTYSFHHIVQRLEMSDHTVRIVIVEVEPRRLFKTLEPLLMPQDSHSDQFTTDDLSLR